MECFGAGYRTGFLTFRQEIIPKKHPEAFRYVEWAWPRKTDKTGFFWSNIKSENAIRLVLKNLVNVSQEEWEKIIEPYKNKLVLTMKITKLLKIVFG